MALYSSTKKPAVKARSKTATASQGSGVGSVPPSLSQVAQGVPLATPAPPNTFVPTLGPADAFQAQYDQLLAGPTNAANATYDTGVKGSFGDEGTFANRIGATLGANGDPNAVTSGSFDWGNVEAGNPFSQAALLQRSYAQANRGSTNSLAAGGHVFSGAQKNAAASNTFAYQQGQDTLQKQLYDYLLGQGRSRTDALNSKNTTISDAGLEALKALLGS